MMIKICKCYALLLLLFLSAPAICAEKKPSDIVQIKKWLVEKRVKDVVRALRADHSKLIQTIEQRKKIQQWLGVFVFEETLNHYSKAIELQNEEPKAALGYYKKAISLEPQNWKLHGAYISLLMDQKQYEEAQRTIEEKIKEQPYLPIYNLYQQHLTLIQTKKSPFSLTCSSKEYFEIGLKYCRYLKLIIFAKQNAHSSQENEKTLGHLTKQLELPDVSYWRWHLTEKREHLQQYITTCAGRDQWTKQNKEYRLIPGICAYVDEAKTALGKGADAKKE